MPPFILLCCILSLVISSGLILDRKWLYCTPLTPLSVALFGGFLRAVLGPLLVNVDSFSAITERAVVYIRYGANVQLLWIVFCISLVLPYGLFRLCCSDNKHIPQERLKFDKRKLIQFAFATGIFTLAWTSLGLLTGSASRDPELYAHWVRQFSKPDALFIAFGRLKDIFYFLVPLSVVRSKSKLVKTSLIGIVLLNIFAALETGGRGVVLLPILEMYFGTFLLRKNIRFMSILTICVLIISVVGSQLLEGNHKFRLSMSTDSSLSFERIAIKGFTVKLGDSLIGCSDAYNFTEANLAKPGAGAVRADRWIHAWIPSSIKGSTKESPRDAHIIAEQLETGSSSLTAETKNYTSFSCVSYVGDLFWRWRWSGVIIGSLLFSTLYFLLALIWRSLINLQTYSGLLVFCFPVTFLSLYPAGSVGETIWLWSWDIQKYIALYLMLLLSESLLKNHHHT